MLVVFTAITGLLIQTNTRTLRRNLINQSQAFASLATKPVGDTFVLYKDSGRIRIQQQVDTFTNLDANINNVAVVGSDGKVLFSQHPEYQNDSVNPETAASFNPTTEHNSRGNVTRIVYPYLEDFGLRRYSVVYWISSDSISASVRQNTISSLILGVTGLLISALLMVVFVNRLLLKPLSDVSQGAIDISHGALEKQIVLDRRDEIGDLANSINSMANALKSDIQKLQETDKLKTEFIMISSHNLRTPLTIMQGNIELLESLPAGTDIKPFLKSLKAGSSRLHDFAEGMLTISRIEAGGKTVDLQPNSLSPFLQKLAEDFGPLAEQKKISFHYDIPQSERLTLFGSSYLRAALWNILDNALKFTKESGTISLHVAYSQANVMLQIQDTGAGIEAEELKRLFTKFHRGTDAEAYNYEGVGLGLYLTKLIIDQHHGSIELTSEVGKGTTATVILPLLA